MAPIAQQHRRWERRFLRELRRTANVTHSCRVAGITRRVVYLYRDACPRFATAWAEALQDATDRLDAHARQRATVGTRKLVLHQGQPVFVHVSADGRLIPGPAPGSRLEPLYERRVSDVILMMLLKAHRPEVYGPQAEQIRQAEAEAAAELSAEEVETAYERAERDFAEATAAAAARSGADGGFGSM